MIRETSPGVAGWMGVAVSVALADGFAKATHRPTMSDEFNKWFGWGAPVGAAVFAHLVLHKRKEAA